MKIFMDNYSRGNDFAMIKNFRPKNSWWKLLVDNYSWVKDFAMINIFEQKNVDENC